MKKLSIKFRITLWFTAFMLALVGVALAYLFAAGQRMVAGAAQAALMDAVTDSFRDMEYEDGKLVFDDDLRYLSDGAYLSVYDTAGNMLFGRLPSAAAERLPFADGTAQTIVDGDGSWYVYDALYPVENRVLVWIRGVMPASAAEAPFGALTRLSLLALPFLALLAAGGGYLLARRALLPVRRITRIAEEISGGTDLTKRIALGRGRDELYTLAATFDRMFDRLQTSFDSEKQFTSDASHELRTPVSVILAQCQEALQSAETLEEARAALAVALEQAKRMSALVSQLLALARADRGQAQVQRELLDFSELTELVAAQIAEQAAPRGIRLTLDVEPGISLLGDETLLMRMLLNLMENALKYGRDNGHIHVRLRREGLQALGEIEDDGIGISPEQLPKIWDRFYQGDPARGPGRDGAGLGLPMVQAVAHAHGGAVSAQSQAGLGSVFQFSLPLPR